MIIEDGTGKGYNAEVDVKHRLQTFTTSVTEKHAKALDGENYTVGTTTPITLTGTADSAIFYFKNNDEDDIVVTDTFILISGVTQAVGVGIVRNPLTIIPDTGPTGGLLTNSNFGSNNTPNITVIDGIQGASFENGDIWNFYNVINTYFSALGPFVVPKGATFGVIVTPPSNNTEMNINIGFSIFTKQIT